MPLLATSIPLPMPLLATSIFVHMWLLSLTIDVLLWRLGLRSLRAGRGAHPYRGLLVPRPWRSGRTAVLPPVRGRAPVEEGDLGVLAVTWHAQGLRPICSGCGWRACGESARDAPACIQIVPGTVERAQAGQRSARDAPPSPASKRVARHARRGGGSWAQRRACAASVRAGRRDDRGREGRRDRLRRPLLATGATVRGALPAAVLRRRSGPARISPTSLPLRRSSTRPGSAAAGRRALSAGREKGRLTLAPQCPPDSAPRPAGLDARDRRAPARPAVAGRCPRRPCRPAGRLRMRPKARRGPPTAPPSPYRAAR